MTDEELREIRARSDAASEDPSTWNTLGYSVVVNDVPRLLDEIERLRGTLEFALDNDRRQSERIAQLMQEHSQ